MAVRRNTLVGVLCAALLCNAAAQGYWANATSPIDKVVLLIKSMKEQCVKDMKEDTEAYDKYKCWCITTEREKKAAIEDAEAKIEELNAFLEEAAAKEGELKTQIAELEEDIASDKEALASATALREKENKAFVAEEADLKESLALLAEAIGVLQKVQLMQKPPKEALVQVRNIVQRVAPRFSGVMKKDLYDMLGALESVEQEKIGDIFLPKNRAASLQQEWQRQGLHQLPWIKTEEQIGKEANPNELKGMAVGAKSYNSRSGQILGILKAMGDNMAKDLADAQKEELRSEIDFQNLQAAKLGEIASATKQKEAKELQLSDLLYKVSQSKKELEDTQKQLEEDQKFLALMQNDCAKEDAEYAKRTKVRNEEITALAETLDILTGDEARSLFDKTISFLQVDASTAALQESARNSAMQRILAIAKKNKNWALAGLAVRVKLDAFTKVKEMMDKMMAELQAQQQAEDEKRDQCNKDIDQTEDKIKEANYVKEDLDQEHTELTNELEKLAEEIATLKKEVAEMEIALKEAGEQRKSENGIYQQSVSDQRATIQILTMAQGRLAAFYTPATKAQDEKAGLKMVEIQLHKQPTRVQLGTSFSGSTYESSSNSGGVMQLLAAIIGDAEAMEGELQVTEQNQQKNYADYVAATTATIEADRTSIAQKEERTAEAQGEKSDVEESQLANNAALDKLNELLHGFHTDCDWIIKYFDIRQKARADEMNAIQEAKAILSGANFGKAQ
jgi:hypothetical protein